MALIVREIVAFGAVGAVVCAAAAAARRMMARVEIFTRVLDLGEMRAS